MDHPNFQPIKTYLTPTEMQRGWESIGVQNHEAQRGGMSVPRTGYTRAPANWNGFGTSKLVSIIESPHCNRDSKVEAYEHLVCRMPEGGVTIKGKHHDKIDLCKKLLEKDAKSYKGYMCLFIALNEKSRKTDSSHTINIRVGLFSKTFDRKEALLEGIKCCPPDGRDKFAVRLPLFMNKGETIRFNGRNYSRLGLLQSVSQHGLWVDKVLSRLANISLNHLAIEGEDVSLPSGNKHLDLLDSTQKFCQRFYDFNSKESLYYYAAAIDNSKIDSQKFKLECVESIRDAVLYAKSCYYSADAQSFNPTEALRPIDLLLAASFSKIGSSVSVTKAEMLRVAGTLLLEDKLKGKTYSDIEVTPEHLLSSSIKLDPTQAKIMYSKLAKILPAGMVININGENLTKDKCVQLAKSA